NSTKYPGNVAILNDITPNTIVNIHINIFKEVSAGGFFENVINIAPTIKINVIIYDITEVKDAIRSNHCPNNIRINPTNLNNKVSINFNIFIIIFIYIPCSPHIFQYMYIDYPYR